MPASPDTLRVLIADDHQVVRMGIATILEVATGFEVVAQASNGSEAVRLFLEHRPDVTLMDVRMPLLTGVEAVRAIRRNAPDACIVMLSTFDSEEDAFQAFEAGAAGYLLKTSLGREMTAAIRQAHSGIPYVPELIAAKLAQRTPNSQLSAREAEVLQAMSGGLNNQEIADTLGVTANTVKTHAKQIFLKLCAKDRAHAVCIGIERGIIVPK